MENPNAVKITTRDKLLRAWLNSTEMVRDYETYSKEISDDDEARDIFRKFAETEAVQAARFREMLLDRQNPIQ